MHSSIVQNIGTFGYSKEAGTLLESLGAQLWDLQKLFAGGKRAIGLPIGHHIFGGGGGKASHPLQ